MRWLIILTACLVVVLIVKDSMESPESVYQDARKCKRVKYSNGSITGVYCKQYVGSESFCYYSFGHAAVSVDCKIYDALKPVEDSK